MVNWANSTTILDPGDIVIIEGTRYRLLTFQKESTLIQMDTTKTIIKTVDMDFLLEGIKSDRIHVTKRETSLFLLDEENCFFKKRLALIRDIEEKYDNVFTFYINRKKETLDFLRKKHGVSLVFIMDCIRIYMQSGYDTTALMPSLFMARGKARADQKRRGRKKENRTDGYTVSDKDTEAFEYALKKYKNNPDINMYEAYILMICRFYSHTDTDCNHELYPVTKLFDYNARPTYTQLRYRILNSK